MRGEYFIILLVVLILTVFQLMTTERRFVTNISSEQIANIIKRPKFYPFAGYKFEVSTWAIGYNNWRKNFWENININLYFFGGHPIERDIDFEIFPFWLLPVSMVGLYIGIKKKWFVFLLVATLMAISFISLWGNRSVFGPIVTYPFWVLSLFLGFKKCLRIN